MTDQIEGMQIMQILKSLQMNNTIDNQKFIQCVKKVKKLNDNLIQMQEIEKTSILSLAKLKEQNNKYNLEFASKQEEHREQQETINNLTEEMRKAKIELAEYENTRIANKIYECEQKKENIDELKKRIQESVDEQVKRLKDDIEKYQKAFKSKNDQILEEENQIKVKQQQIEEFIKLKESIEASNITKINSIEEQKDDILRKKNGIQNEKKHIEQNEQAYNQLLKEKEEQEKRLDEKKKEENIKNDNIKLVELRKVENKEKEVMLKKELENKEKEKGNMLKNKKEIEKENVKLLEAKNMKKEDKEKAYKNLVKVKEYKEMQRKQVDEKIKLKKDKENEKIKQKFLKEEEENLLRLTRIKLDNLEKDILNLEKSITDIDDEINFKVRKEKNKDQLITIENSCYKEFSNQEKTLESKKKMLINEVEQIKSSIEEMKNIRQTMSRAVAAREEKTRAINDEIQIKELIFLDMTKKHEELKNKYQKYHEEYEEKLNERNKNLLKIQNANQRKSETREKMKIISTEMDILQSELNETNNQITEKKKQLDKIKQEQDGVKKEINEYQFKLKMNEEEIKKLTNENEKLHSILNCIENDMVTKRSDYEVACESRNLSGIHLIDKNDELCVFYEKIQHLENEINTINKSIIEKEHIIQRLKVDNSEIERFIEVNRKKIPLIPNMSNSIKELDNELKLLNKALEELVNHIESPENEELKRELPGEDPEIDYLKIKYEQLSEMLNEKKEVLLEKELINEEINEIAEKLRKKALEDRAKNLDISEKMNSYEIQFNEITRRNIAVTSELSMFKAILYNLENTKKEKEEAYLKANEKYENGEAPTDDCINKLENMIKIESFRKEVLNKRLEEVNEKLTRPYIMPNRKGPQKRFNEYEDAETGLKKSYGQYAPFAVYPTPPNMRHLRGIGKMRSSSQRELSASQGDFGRVYNI